MLTKRFELLSAAVLAALLALAAGCSGKSQVFADTVEGTLTLDGAPVPDALVEFVPDVPDSTRVPNSTAVTDAKGFFRLTRSDNQKLGALVGPHHVIVFPGRQSVNRDDRDDQGGAGRGAVQVPSVYTIAARTPLKVEVTPDRTTYELRLSRNGAAAR